MSIIEQAKLNPKIIDSTFFFNRDECMQLGKSLNSEYVSNNPYPHIVLDNFLPTACLQRVIEEFPERDNPRFSDAQSKLKTGYRMEMIDSPYITNLLNALNSSQFITFLGEMTGIKNLIPDPHFSGGGLHETASGGHLSIHADFNILRGLNLRRRINLILFLNENWEEKFGGHLELWSKDMKKLCSSVSPVIGRAVVFNTETDSFHGHPDPTTSPPDVYRRSIALYYFTALEYTLTEQSRTTNFRVRPGSKDQGQPISVRAREIARDLTPPMIARWLDR